MQQSNDAVERPAAVRHIAVEEAFITTEIMEEGLLVLARDDCEVGFRAMGRVLLGNTPGHKLLHDKLLDIGEGRIAHMDEVGIDQQILSLSCTPGVQVFDTALAIRLAQNSNDALSQAVSKFPTRFAGLGALAPQDPEAAAREIGRMRSLGLCGAVINLHTFGEYLDLPKFDPLLSALEDQELPLYLHPREPSSAMIQPYLDYGLFFATWGFAAETALHALRLIMSGTLERHPHLKIILGHMGEGLPFWLQRIDSRYQMQTKIGAIAPLKRLPSEYFLENFIITTAGVTSMPALRLAIDVVGVEKILFAADYPFEDDGEAVAFLRSADISSAQRNAIAYENAQRIFGIA